MQRLVLIGCIAIALDGEIAGSAVPRRPAGVGSPILPVLCRRSSVALEFICDGS